MISKKSWLIFFGLVLAVSLWGTSAAAFDPPLQDVTAWVDGATVRFKVYDPLRGKVVEDSWTLPVGVTIYDLSVRQGVVSWRGTSPWQGVGSAVYDAGRGCWKTAGDFTDYVEYYTPQNQDGVVAGFVIYYDFDYFPTFIYLHYRQYDPAAGVWKMNKIQIASVINGLQGELIVKDGVVAWNHNYGGQRNAGYAIYDPSRSQWMMGSVAPPSEGWIHDLGITNATVHYKIWEEQLRSAGYDPASGAWYGGATIPLAAFTAQPVAGVRPLWVWFTDMSIAGAAWSWTFGDGATSTSRSTYHTYAQAEVFQAGQGISGPNGSHAAQKTIRVFAAPTLLGVSWYSDPSSPLLAINPANGAGSAIGPTGFNSLNSLARDKVGNLYSASGNQLIRIDPVTGAGTAVATLNFGATPVDVRGLAFSPDGVLFAVVNDTSNADLLYTVNVATGVGTLVGDTGLFSVQSITFDSRGALYGWDTYVGLVTINPGTGAATDVNPAQEGTTDIQGIAFGPDRILYGARNALYKINTATGAWTLVGAGGYADVRGLEAALVTPITRTSLPAIILNLLSD